MMNEIKAWLVYLMDEETEEELPHSDYVFFGTWDEICDHTAEQYKYYTACYERPTQVCECEYRDDDMAYTLWKYTQWRDTEYCGPTAKEKWLAYDADWRLVESAIYHKFDVWVDDSYCKRLLPLVQNYYRNPSRR